MKKMNIEFSQIEDDLKKYNNKEIKKLFKEDLDNGKQVTLFGYTFTGIDKFGDMAGHFKNLKDHKIINLIELAIKLNITTLKMIKDCLDSYPEIIQWSLPRKLIMICSLKKLL